MLDDLTANKKERGTNILYLNFFNHCFYSI
jgi:hypothetical protein